MIIRALLFALAAFVLAGCGGGGNLGSIAGGESKVFTAPEYVVLGKTQWDQDWIDGNVEAGIAGFGWKRPKPRPSSFDRLPPARIVAPVKKKTFFGRIKARIIPKPKPKPAEIAAPPVVISPPVIAAPPPKPCDPVENLLGTCGK